MGLVFRNDDVCANTDIDKLHSEFYEPIHKAYPMADILSCVTLFSKKSDIGSVYPDVPFKDKPLEYFLSVDSFLGKYKAPDYVQVASHGTWHFDHSAVSSEAQFCSIVSSCVILDTRIFVPPFNRYNADTEKICKDNGIFLVKPSDGWKSMECEAFNKEHDKWYFHSWRWESNKFLEAIS